MDSANVICFFQDGEAQDAREASDERVHGVGAGGAQEARRSVPQPPQRRAQQDPRETVAVSAAACRLSTRCSISVEDRPLTPLSCLTAQPYLPKSHLPKANWADGGTANIKVIPTEVREREPMEHPVYMVGVLAYQLAFASLRHERFWRIGGKMAVTSTCSNIFHRCCLRGDDKVNLQILLKAIITLIHKNMCPS